MTEELTRLLEEELAKLDKEIETTEANIAFHKMVYKDLFDRRKYLSRRNIEIKRILAKK